jgi:uncharacterized membrane protein YfcA
MQPNLGTFLFLLLTLFAEIIGTVGGFGSSVFFVPIGNFFFDFHVVLGLTAVFHLASNVSKIVLFRQGLDKKLIIQLGLPSVLFVVIGGYLSKAFDGQMLEVLLGIFLVLLSAFFLLKSEIEVPKNTAAAVIGGAASGFSAGLLGTGGAIRGLTMAAFNLEKSVYIATSAFIDLLVDASRTVVYYQNGFINRDTLKWVPALLIIGFLGTWIGQRLLAKISQERFKQISLLLILGIGITMLLKQWYSSGQ